MTNMKEKTDKNITELERFRNFLESFGIKTETQTYDDGDKDLIINYSVLGHTYFFNKDGKLIVNFC